MIRKLGMELWINRGKPMNRPFIIYLTCLDNSQVLKDKSVLPTTAMDKPETTHVER
jgi:hypothetical protein